ncbi:MAG: ATP-binding cassette domain-containing protein [Erysipelotrichaceae bacterium]|nr:ATP-binding cassette domain-containing protein [Erysipelotrichaceae bacterium]
MTQIEAKNLSLGCEKQKVVSDLNFTVSEGDYLCIIGENGSGKTTLMKTLLSLNAPLKGEIVFSEDVKKNQIAYSQLVNILKEPDEYLGTPIKVKGITSAPFNGFSHVYNYTVTIQDNTQCCAKGIEFFLRNENDLSLLPEEGELVTIKGTLDLFEEGKHAYFVISDAMIEQ